MFTCWFDGLYCCVWYRRYRKLRRDVPQSRWVIDGERKGSVSVEEVLAAALLPALAADGHTFMAAGEAAV